MENVKNISSYHLQAVPVARITASHTLIPAANKNKEFSLEDLKENAKNTFYNYFHRDMPIIH